MGWHIHCVKNTVVINAAVAKDLFEHELSSSVWDRDEEDELEDPLSPVEYITQKDKDGWLHLYFSYDRMEHLDYVSMEWVQDVLKKHSVRGDICFSSSAGDNAGESWGYRFNGEGGMVNLKGVLTFFEAPAKTLIPKEG